MITWKRQVAGHGGVTLKVIGDFNTKFGKENIQRQMIVKHTLDDVTGGNGVMLTEFAVRSKLVIQSTFFPHKRIRLRNWRTPDLDVLNQIDHVLVAASHSSSVIDVRTCGGPNCDSDHCLVKAVVRERLANVEKALWIKKKKWNIKKLKVEAERKECERILDRILKGEGMERNIEEELKTIEKAVKKAAEETIGENRNVRNEDWFDEDCRAAIAEKNRARQRMSQREARGNVRKYHQLRSGANKICRKKSKKSLSTQCEEVEQLNQQSELRMFYRAVDRLKKL
jgi:hypothetical protein